MNKTPKAVLIVSAFLIALVAVPAFYMTGCMGGATFHRGGMMGSGSQRPNEQWRD